VNELYAETFSLVYKFHTIGLRYFNIFGPKQNPNNPYAAVIPIFCKHFLDGTHPTINGDGKTSRDFTFIENAVQANVKAMLSSTLEHHEVMNVACGDQVSLNDLVKILQIESGNTIHAKFASERLGDVKHSKASIEKIIQKLNYYPKFSFVKGIKITYNWYKLNQDIK
jgi:UDP-N-acetylglucosamine 4-epimerase